MQDPDSSQDQEASMDDSMGPEIGAVSPIKEARAALLQEKLSAQALKADSEVSKFRNGLAAVLAGRGDGRSNHHS
jgi:hypothetical protein